MCTLPNLSSCQQITVINFVWSGVLTQKQVCVCTCIGCVCCIIALYVMAHYLVPKQAVVHPGLCRASLLKAKL